MDSAQYTFLYQNIFFPYLLCLCIVLVKLFNIPKRGDFTKVGSAICQDVLSLYCFFFPPLLVPSRKSISKDNGCAKRGFVCRRVYGQDCLSAVCEQPRTMWLLCYYGNIRTRTKCLYDFFIPLHILPRWADGSAVRLLKVNSANTFCRFVKPVSGSVATW